MANTYTPVAKTNGNTQSISDMQALIAKLQADKAVLQDKLTTKQTLRFKVSEKGAVSVYGLSARFPTTLYAGQWERLFDAIPQLQQFIADNAEVIARKDE